MKKFLLIFFLIAPAIGFPNNYFFKNFITSDGLSTLKTNKVIQDNEGYIWIATENGLNRFDGTNFKVYTQNIKDSTSILGNVIMDLLIDHKGVMWIATEGGVCKYIKELDCFSPAPDSAIAREYSRAILQDKKNNYWIVNENTISIFNKKWKKLESFNNNPEHKNYLGDASFYCIDEDNDGLIWIGTQKKGFLSYNFETKEIIKFGDRIGTQEIFNIFSDSYGNIWIGTPNAPYLYVKSEDKLINLQLPDCEMNLPRVPVSCTFEDNNGDIWLCHWGNGVTKYNLKDNIYEWYKPADNNSRSFSSGSVEYGFQDKNGNLWFTGATTGLTVSYASSKKMNIIIDPNNPDAGIFRSPVTAITKDLNGNFWFGTDGSGITIWNPYNNIINEYKHSPSDTLSYGGTSVLSLYTNNMGHVWGGGYNSGLNLFNPEDENFTVFLDDKAPPYNISGKNILDIAEDGQGNIWVATKGGGVNKINPVTLEKDVYKVENGLAHNSCICLFYDEGSDKMWIGSYGGLTIFDISSGTTKIYTKDGNNPKSLQSNWINDIYKDSKNRYWIGTQLGISFFDTATKEFTTFLENDGLANNSIMSLQEGPEGNIWIGTMDGLTKFNPDEQTFFNYNINDGLPDNQFRVGAVFHAGDQLYFGTNKGVLYFNPSEIKENTDIPIIRFTDLIINNKRIIPGRSKILKKHIDYSKTIKLKHNESFIRIEFIGLSYFQANNNTYKYMLEGVDEKWVDSKTTNYASYANIKHGHYTFKVQAFNNDGTPSEIREIKFRIRPAWYNTKIFWLIIIGSIIYFLVKVYSSREEQIKKDKEKLESKIKENEAKLNEKIREIEEKEKEILNTKEEESELKFQHEGIAKFSDIIASHRENINELTTSLITNIVKYIDANAGIIYVADESDTGKTILKPIGDFCFDSDEHEKHSFEDGEGNVGTCFNQKKIIELNDLPDGYIILRSGLGETSLKYSVLCPIIHEDKCLGVFELASLEKLEKYKIELVSKISENFASVLAISKANEQTKEMLKQNKIQSEELMAQEEEMRQNMEEMQATQEELTRQMEANKKTQNELLQEKALIDTFLKNAREYIYFKDKESRFIKASQSMATIFKVKNVEEIYGKSDFNFFTEEHARPAFEDEQEIIRTGNPIIDKIEKETYKDGTIKYVNTSKMPLYNENNEIIGTFGISKDVTESVTLKKEAEEIKENYKKLEKIIKQKDKLIKELQSKQKK